MSKVEKPQKNQHSRKINQIYCDTHIPEKPRGEFEMIAEDDDDSLSLAS